MNILIIGAGAIGTLLAYRLQQSGHIVTLLARGQRRESLRQHGLQLEAASTHKVIRQRLSAPILLIDRLDPAIPYDLILIVCGYHHLAGLLPSLAAFPESTPLLFMGNNVVGVSEMVQTLGRQRMLLGFPLFSAELRGDVCYFTAGAHATVILGEPDGTLSDRLRQMADLFQSAGFRVERTADIDAWLKSHAAQVVTLSGALYAAHANPLRLAATRDLLILTVRALQEALRVFQVLDIPFLPQPLAWALEWLPEPALVLILRILLHQPAFQSALVDLPHVRAEFLRLAKDLRSLAEASSLPTPSLDWLFDQIEPAVPPLPTGSHSLPLDWRGAFAWLAGLGAVVYLFAWFSRNLSQRIRLLQEMRSDRMIGYKNS